ncbi:bpX6 domain-containing protein [Catellatospora tritici]|uniref:bpX6 domain-containing protein n=1 Tax=Catellatospora tritici TaxID=2851566 RepID=UPI001C2DC0F8|nr:bpX6 domain-containing protein [Catellatospora tritici]MBV1856012.1 hypothetical protein [Catellatospora tritici]
MTTYVTAVGFVLDPRLIGSAQAWSRVAELWQPGTVLRELHDGRWLLELGTPVRVRGDRALGEPLTARGGGLAGYGVDGSPGPREVLLAHGVRHRLDELPEIEVGVDLGEVTSYRLAPLDVPAPEPDPLPEPPQPTVRLRAAAGVPAAPTGVPRGGTRVVRAVNALFVVSATVVAIVVVVAVAGLAVSMVVAGGVSPGLVAAIVVGLMFGIVRAVRPEPVGTDQATGRASGQATGRTSGGRRRDGAGREPLWRRLAARLTMLGPAGAMLRRRHLAYLRQVHRAFAARDWERALRAAVPLGGLSQALAFGLPRGWQGVLAATPEGRTGGRGLAVANIDDLFGGVYREAAVALERAGEVDKAAYVLADLLDAPAEAVQLLERHDRFRTAAELAEGRKLETALVVRAWWRAGDRRRAVDIALARGAFAQVLDRLGPADPALARELRTAWARSRREAGDPLGAIAAAWPDPSLRPAAVADIQAAMATGGPVGAAALAYLLSLDPTAAEPALALLEREDPALDPARSAFLDVFGTVRAATASADRRIATAAVRRLTRDGTLANGRRTRDALSDRADALAVADLPPVAVPPARQALALPMPSGRAGQLPVHDAVALSNTLVLLAHGGHGLRLVRPDGRVVARWDVPAHRLIPADSGTHVLVASAAEGATELHRLDLAARTVRRWTTLRAQRLPSSYDGHQLTYADGDGIVFAAVDGPPRVTWRELDGRHPLHLFARSATSMAALVTPPGDRRTELWQWDLPQVMLRRRPPVDLDGVHQAVLLATGELVAQFGGRVRMLREHRWSELSTRGDEVTLYGNERVYALVDGDRISVGAGSGELVQLTAVAGLGGLHAHRGRLAVWDQEDRVLVVDTEAGRALGAFPTRPG